MNSEIQKLIFDQISKSILAFARKANSYSINDINAASFKKYIDIFEMGYLYSKKDKWRLISRSVSNPSEFFRNTILGISSNSPVYDGYSNWINQPCKNINYNFDSSIKDYKLNLPSKDETIVYCKDIARDNLSINELGDILSSGIDISTNTFGEDSYSKLKVIVDLVKECHDKTKKKVIVIEIGPGTGYWVNKAASQLNKLKIPCLFICIELFFFNSLNTKHMSQFFGTTDQIISINADAHYFNWQMFIDNNEILKKNPIVIHTSGVTDPYIYHITLNNLFKICSEYELFGGEHFEADAFTLLNNDQKSKYIEEYSKLNNNLLPSPPGGVRSIAAKFNKRLHKYSYLDPYYRSNINMALDMFSKNKVLKVKNSVPFQNITSNLIHRTSWRTI